VPCQVTVGEVGPASMVLAAVILAGLTAGLAVSARSQPGCETAPTPVTHSSHEARGGSI